MKQFTRVSAIVPVINRPNINADTMFLEVSHKNGKSKMGLMKSLQAELYTEWNAERIAGAFGYGKGHIIDFYRYALDNAEHFTILKV